MKFLMVYLTFREGKELYKTLNSYLLGSGYPSLERPLQVSRKYALLMDHERQHWAFRGKTVTSYIEKLYGRYNRKEW